MTAIYGTTITVPCNDGAPPPENLMFIKWKYVSRYFSSLNAASKDYGPYEIMFH